MSSLSASSIKGERSAFGLDTGKPQESYGGYESGQQMLSES